MISDWEILRSILEFNYAITPGAIPTSSNKMCFSTRENRACRRRWLWEHKSARGPDGHWENKHATQWTGATYKSDLLRNRFEIWLPYVNSGGFLELRSLSKWKGSKQRLLPPLGIKVLASVRGQSSFEPGQPLVVSREDAEVLPLFASFSLPNIKKRKIVYYM